MNNRKEWLSQVQEDIIDPERPIVDPHHHLWKENPRRKEYLVENLWEDTDTGHNIEKTVFVECNAEYLTDGPENLRPLGETQFVAEAAAQTAQDPNRATIGAIVSFARLLLGDQVEEVLQAHIEAGNGLFRGIRNQASWSASEAIANSRVEPPPHLYANPKFQEGFAQLGSLGLSFDAWLYHTQISDLTELARKFPDTTIIMDHFGGPLGIGPYANYRDEVFAKWKQDVATLSQCPNVNAKLGGIAMPLNGFGWDTADKPATSDDIVEAHRPYYMHTIEHFGPNRCMFESNFPVEKVSVSYPVLWNAFKKMAAEFSEDEKEALFRGTATRVYKID
jgi:predicted TIM-barrel fold metal-dependent hydrolase